MKDEIIEEVPVKHIPTHEDLRAEGINLPDWVPVEDILLDNEAAQMRQNFAYYQMVEAYRERVLGARHVKIY